MSRISTETFLDMKRQKNDVFLSPVPFQNPFLTDECAFNRFSTNEPQFEILHAASCIVQAVLSDVVRYSQV